MPGQKNVLAHARVRVQSGRKIKIYSGRVVVSSVHAVIGAWEKKSARARAVRVRAMFTLSISLLSAKKNAAVIGPSLWVVSARALSVFSLCALLRASSIHCVPRHSRGSNSGFIHLVIKKYK